MAQQSATRGGEDVRPVLIELGKVKRKTLRQFRRGRGSLVADVQQALTEVRQGLGAEAAGKELVPIVLVYRRKEGRRLRLPFPW
jgi:hypothetical protein